MNKRVRENLLYVGEELVGRFGRPVLYLLLLGALAAGVFLSFQKVDAFLTPSYGKAKQETERQQQARISIPKIGVEAPIAFVQSTNPDDFLEPLRNGVTHYPSALPGQEGTSILLGHSAPPGWLGSAFDGVFSNLKDLKEGDIVSVAAGGVSYRYRVNGSTILQRGQDIPETAMLESGSRLLLLSCWPPGIDNKRIMVQADTI